MLPACLSGLRALLASAVLAVTLVAVPAHPADAAAASISLVTPTSITGEKVKLRVKAGHRIKRPVRLQYREGGRWRLLLKGTTDADGRKTFTVRTARASLPLRAKFPKVKRQGKVRPRRTTSKVVLRTVSQAVALQVTKSESTRSASAVATTTPARKGRLVSLQRREVDGTWRTIVPGRATDAKGRVEFPRFATAVDAVGRRFRVRVATWKGAPALDSAAATVDWPIGVTASAPTVGVDGEPTILRASTTGPVASVRFYIDGQEVARDSAEPWEAAWPPVRGRHDVSVRAIGPGGSVLSTVVEFDQPGLASDASTGLPPGFTIDTVQSGFDLPTAFAATETGRVFVAEKSGRVLTFMRSPDGSSSPSELVADLSDRVAQMGDQGMTGLALHPRFGDGTGERDLVYVSYVVKDPGPDGGYRGQQVQVLDVADWQSGDDPLPFDEENVILGRAAGPDCVTREGPYPTDCLPIIGGSHTINDLVFDHDGSLLVGVGDGASFAAGLEARSQSLRAQDPTVLAGKVLRIDPETGRGVPRNPYYGDPELDGGTPGESNASRVAALGLRNPFRLAVREDGLVMIGDVGEGDWEELDALAHDHDAAEPANFGWPCYEGERRTKVPVSDGEPDAESNPWDRCALLWARGADAVVGPVHTYPHAGGASVTGGVFYTGEAYPADFHDSYVFGDYAQDFIRTARVDEDGAVSHVETFAPKGVAGGPVKFAQGPDDRIWYASIYDGSIRVIDYATPAAVTNCPVDTFARTYHDLTDSSLANDPASYPEGWAWVRLADAVLPVASVGPRECVDVVRFGPVAERPHADLPSDHYGVRWQGRVRFDGGTYDFTFGAKDWGRLWVDDVPVGVWFGKGGFGTETPVRISAGIHTVRAELVHDAGDGSAALSWAKVTDLPTVAVSSPVNGHVVVARDADGVLHGDLPVEVRVAALDGAPDLLRAIVSVDLIHVTGHDQHAHPWSSRTFGLDGGMERSGLVTATFGISDEHAPRNSVFRVRARVEDASGASRLSAPVYVCLERNAAGICAVD